MLIVQRSSKWKANFEKGFTPSKFTLVKAIGKFIVLLKRNSRSHKQNIFRTSTGFTLAELLITIAIIATLAGAMAISLNVGELLGQARDSKRIGELNSLAQAVTLHANSLPGGYKGEDSTVYISLPDTSTDCANLLASLPSIPIGWSYHCAPEADLRESNGDGWLPVNLAALPGGSPFNQLPIDPKNTVADNLYFAYVHGDGYILTSLVESAKGAVTASNDGGADSERIEIGSDFSLWATVVGE